MPKAHYTVDGVCTVAMGDKVFGPYSSLDTAMAAASKAARKAEEQGYEAFVTVNTPGDADTAPHAAAPHTAKDRDAA